MPGQEKQPQTTADAEIVSVSESAQRPAAEVAVSANPAIGVDYLRSKRPPTDAKIAKAAEHGFDLAKQEKYYSRDEWANRNK